jgi:hypothetical protein
MPRPIRDGAGACRQGLHVGGARHEHVLSDRNNARASQNCLNIVTLVVALVKG